MITCCDQQASKGLRARFSCCLHLIAPRVIAKCCSVHGIHGKQGVISRIEHSVDFRIVRYQCCRLQTANLIGFSQCCHHGQGCIEGRSSFRIESTAIEFRTSTRKRFTRENRIKRTIKSTKISHLSSCVDAGVHRVDEVEDLFSPAATHELHGRLP